MEGNVIEEKGKNMTKINYIHVWNCQKIKTK